MRKALTIFAVALFLCGTGLLLFPSFQQLRFGNEASKKIERFYQTIEVLSEEHVLPELHRAFVEYNEDLVAKGQGALSVKGGYESFPVSLQEHGFPDDMIGYLTIPAVDMKTPVYLGASDENLDAGATVLGYTSAPIGGESTNCVIAGHDSWSGAKRFACIEELAAGDEVLVTTPWETRRYLVTSSAVIGDDDFDAICIQPGKDMLTLITCHYQGRATMRYAVYCECADEEKAKLV